MAKSGYEMNVIGVPKTIDNDLFGTDHCPGFASAAKYIATSIMEINLDAKVYDTPMVCVIEAMGRNAGWLTAAAQLANAQGYGADLIYLPEVDFDVDKFVADVKEVCAKNNNKCIAVVSEGIHDKDGVLICEKLGSAAARDSFGHAQLGGVAAMLAGLIKAETGYKTRGIELSLMQRCASHCASKTDVEETFQAGREAVKAAVNGETDKMVCYARVEGDEYKCEYKLLPLELAANTEKTVPLEWIINNGTGISNEFVKYAMPLIQGEVEMVKENGLPRFANLKKVLVEKK
jgi:6-phosphofructokinase 1